MRLRRLIPAGVLTALALTGLVAPPAHAAPVDYVALGDSYSSGVGAPGASGTCVRSPQGYPGLWRASHEVSSYADVSCAAAVTSDVLRNQVGALSAGTDVVTITIGGNDAGFASAVLSCSYGSSTSCRRAVESGLTDDVGDDLDSTYAAIQDRAPNARVIVLGYPRLFEETRTCGLFGMSLTNRRIMNQGADALTAFIAARAAAAGLEFVDVRQAFAGHGICASTPWINGSSGGTGAYHPNAAGYRGGYLAALNAVTG